jgi:uncharacterized membrane protein
VSKYWKNPSERLERGRLLIVITSFALLYCSISLVNHYNFRTYALDLGMFNQALYAYSKGRTALFTLDPNGPITHFLATHFSPITILYTPFYYVFGSYTLLLLQVASVLLGGLGMYKAALLLTKNKVKASFIVLLQFFLSWGVFSAIAYDFHNNVVGAMMVPWLLYFLLSGKTIPFVGSSILFWSAQETMGLWYPFLIGGLLWHFKDYWSLNQLKKNYIPLCVLSVAYTFVVLVYLMPALQNHDHNLLFTRYAHLGHSLGAILKQMMLHPINTIGMLFKNTLGDADFDYVKTEFYLAFLLSGGYCLLFSPRLLLLMLPIIAQKMLSNNFVFWGVNAQYSIECVPVLCLASLAFFVRKPSNAAALLLLNLILTTAVTARLLDSRISKWYQPENVRFYQKEHYVSFVNVGEVNSILALIPNDVNISVSSRLAPHLAERKFLYHFPVLKDAQYIALLKTNNDYWPMKHAAEYVERIGAYRHNENWELLEETPDIVVFKRKL